MYFLPVNCCRLKKINNLEQGLELADEVLTLTLSEHSGVCTPQLSLSLLSVTPSSVRPTSLIL